MKAIEHPTPEHITIRRENSGTGYNDVSNSSSSKLTSAESLLRPNARNLTTTNLNPIKKLKKYRRTNRIMKLCSKEKQAKQEILLKAILAKNYNKIKDCIDAGADLTRKCEDPFKILEKDAPAIYIMSTRERDKFLFRKIAVERRWTPLHLAAYMGDVKTIKALLEKKANIVNYQVNDQYSGLETALHIAVEKGNFDAVQYLLENGADPNLDDRSSHTPLEYIMSPNDRKTVKELLKHDAAFNPKTINHHVGTIINRMIINNRTDDIGILTYTAIRNDYGTILAKAQKRKNAKINQLSNRLSKLIIGYCNADIDGQGQMRLNQSEDLESHAALKASGNRIPIDIVNIVKAYVDPSIPKEEQIPKAPNRNLAGCMAFFKLI